MLKLSATLCISLAFGFVAAAQAPPPKGHTHATLLAVRTPTPPVVDGHLNDEVWALAAPVTTFTQQDPNEGQPATERTEIRLLYDDDAVYVCARLFDSQPDLISRRLSKRDDDADADRVTIYLDPMLDHLTGVYFRVSASGVQKDASISNDVFEDSTWDAVWQSAVTVDATGWSAEVRIPLSQLRFPLAARTTWGVNVARYIRRKNETDWLERVPKNESGLASRMAHVDGFDGIARRPHFQALPYAAARSEFIAPSSGNPFNSGARAFASGGVDFKWGITSKVTLDGTINPDFGQVEVDPAVVNLSAFETFFEERRPFFLEGGQIFNNFGRNGATNYWGFNTSDPLIFYSRRIGRTPQVNASGEFIDAPNATTILAATKLTGRTASGWTIGLLDAMTARETARVMSDAVAGSVDVEPRTNYFVSRIHRDVGDRGGLGFIATAVTRDLDTPAFTAALTKPGIRRRGRWLLVSQQPAELGGERSARHQRDQRLAGRDRAGAAGGAALLSASRRAGGVV